ncbi:MAG TPA: glycosyltransferase family 4 protein [Candidatus Dormibacteraeota bacterium]|nr:glycosyltransferase family 4 protein [Candidatus Dormibacteraeota bacterium]
MRVAVATHFYPPEPGAGALRVRSMVDAFAAAGHDVTVVTTFPSFPSGAFSERRRPFVRVERNGRVRVVRLNSILVPRMPGGRLLHWLTAALSASLYLLATRDHFDVVVISSPPITLSLPGLVGAARHGARLIVDVRDVFPDLGVALGVWKKDGLVVRALGNLVRRLYRRADLVVVVTPHGQSQIAARGVDPSRIVLARNAYERSPLLAEYSRPRNGFTAIYAGNLGLTTDVDVLADAAALVAADNITIEIVGDGAQRTRLGERIEHEGIGNLRLKGSFPRQEALAMVASADVSIVPLRKGLTESIPTKLYDSLSVGCPVVVAAEGEAIQEGTSLGALCTPAGDAEALAAVLRQLSVTDRSALRKLGETGKSRLQSLADRSDIMAALVGRIAALS